MLKTSYIFLFLLFFFPNLKGQDDRDLSTENSHAIRFFNRSLEWINQNNYKKAILWLNRAIEEDDDFVEAKDLIANLYYKTENYGKAIDFFKQVLSIDAIRYKSRYYQIGLAYFGMEKYQEARKYLEKLKTTGIQLSAKNKILLDKKIIDCKFAIEALKKPFDFKPRNLGSSINTKYNEYLPAITANEKYLLFTRKIQKNEDFYFSTKDFRGEWKNAIFFSSKINTPQYNEGAQSLSIDGKYLYYTGCNRIDGLGRCDIYFSRKAKKGWSTPINVGAPINSEHWESQPSISADGQTLFFVSNQPGGYGGYDIWYSELVDGDWTEPLNLGPNINTSMNDQSPFIHPDGETLYFSSEGWPGMGEDDIYISRKDSLGLWTKPQNMGYPINTNRSDFGMIISTDGNTGYFASNLKSNHGGLDIYAFTMSEINKPKKVIFFKGKITDSNLKSSIIADVELTNVIDKKVVYSNKSDEDGEFVAALKPNKVYSINILKDDYLLYSDKIVTNKEGRPSSIEINIPIEKIKKGKRFILHNIYFLFDNAELQESAIFELRNLLSFFEKNPSIAAVIEGHTDNYGTHEYNLELSEKRAKAIVNFLVRNGVQKDRITYKGFGATKPYKSNDTSKGRVANRRAEVIITSY